MKNITETIDKYLNENPKEDLARAKELLQYYMKKHNNNQRRVRQDILDNIVNTRYGRHSNDFVELMWSLFNKAFPS